MATVKTLNLCKVDVPTLDIILPLNGVEQLLHVTLPSLGLVEELTAAEPKLREAAKAGDAEALKLINDIYDILAKLMSCNLEHIEITGENVSAICGGQLDRAIVIYQAYIEFFTEITRRKN